MSRGYVIYMPCFAVQPLEYPYTDGPCRHSDGHIYTYRRGLWVLKNRLKSVVRDLEIRLCKQLKIRQESAKIES